MTSLKPIDIWAGESVDFNRHAADVVFKRMMLMDDDEALMFGRVIVAGSLQHDLIAHREVIGKAMHDQFLEREQLIRRTLTRTAVSKARAHEDNSTELEALLQLEIAKADDTEVRRDYARRQHRDSGGRFAEGHVKIGYDSTAKPLADKHAQAFGIQAATHLNGEDKSRFQQAYQQVSDLIAPYTHLGSAGDALVHLNIVDKDGAARTQIHEVPKGGAPLRVADLKPGEHIQSAAVTVAPATNFPGASYDALSALGAPRAGATVAGAATGGALDADRLREFNDQLGRKIDQDEFIPSRRVFHRLEHGSKLLQDSLGDNAPRKVQYALAVGQHVGRYGPEAQKVIGPTADRTAYRYRGTERSLDSRLGNALESIRRDPRLQTPEDKREELLHGTQLDNGWKPSGVLSYFKSQLPNADLNTLQVKSGNVPPSQGIIIDRAGKAVHQSVGYGDDWYLPFNLKNLKSLKGGEYIRTRTFGGPTTEDIYTGLVGGAHAMTVVSHNGTYTVDFDDNLRGGRRFNDNAARMVARYGQLLDAVKSGQVETGGIAPSRLSELEDQASKVFDRDSEPDRWQGEFTKLKAQEKRQPRLSQQQQGEATVEFFNNLAAQQGDGDAQVQNADDLVAAFVVGAANKDYAEDIRQQREMRARAKAQGLDVPSGPIVARRTLDDYKAARAEALYDPNPVIAGRNIADALGKRRQLDAYLKRASDTNARSLKSLQLDGQGYALALDALQEQFPYYIQRVEFHPWDDARNARDTGYIKPRHNRPAEALSGYFDPTISRNGTGKVRADTTRWQNRRLRPVEVKESRPAPEEDAPARAAVAEPTPDDGARLRAASDEALFTALRNPATFTAAPSGKYGALAGAPVDTWVDEIAKESPQLAAVRRMSHEDFVTQMATSPADLHATLVAAHDYNKRTGLIDVDEAVARTFENGGRAPALVPLPASRSDLLAAPNAEYDLGHLHRAYDRDSGANAADIRSAYQQDPLIRTLVASDELPEGLDDSDFNQMANQLQLDLNGKRGVLMQDIARGVQPSEAQRRAVDRPAEGLIRARSLHRRHGEAVSREAQVIAAPVAASGGQQVTVGFINPDDPDNLQRLAATMQGLGAGPPA